MTPDVAQVLAAAVALVTEQRLGDADQAVLAEILEDCPSGHAILFADAVDAFHRLAAEQGPEPLRRNGIHFARAALGLDP